MSSCDARREIETLVYQYARAVRTSDPRTMIDLFADDATFQVRSVDPGDSAYKSLIDLIGRGEILQYLQKSAERREWTCPLIHNLMITVEGDRASSDCVMVGADRTGTPKFMGFYQDRYRSEGSWKFAARIFTVVGGAN